MRRQKLLSTILAGQLLLIAGLVVVIALQGDPREGLSAWTPEEVESAVAAGPGFVITRETYLGALREKGLLATAGPQAEARREVLSSLVDRELLALEARARGIDRRLEVRQEVQRLLADHLLDSELGSLTLESFSREAVEGRYEADQLEHSRPPAIRLAHLYFRADTGRGEAGRAEARARAEAALERARGYHATALHFGQLAEELSDDEKTKSKGGDLGMVTRDSGDLPQEVVDLGFRLQAIGEVGGPVESDEGFHIVRLTGRRPALERNFAEVELEVRSKLLREARLERHRELLAAVRARYPVTVREERLGLDEVASAGTGEEKP
ncbi:MAG: peptidylprolyl isomerase [Planctomycetes bacterium]|nr:peptidylprolyl isomerase [Planctomycetota bacterium]